MVTYFVPDLAPGTKPCILMGEELVRAVVLKLSVVCVPLVVREGFSGGTQVAFLSYSKSFVNSFLCYSSFVCCAIVANSFLCYINFKFI